MSERTSLAILGPLYAATWLLVSDSQIAWLTMLFASSCFAMQCILLERRIRRERILEMFMELSRRARTQFGGSA